MRGAVFLVVVLAAACDRRADIQRVSEQHAREVPGAGRVDVGTGPPVHHRFPLRAFAIDSFQRGVLIDSCREALITYDGGYSFVAVGTNPPLSMRSLYDRADEGDLADFGSGNIHYTVSSDYFSARRWGEPETARPLRRAGGGRREAIRESRRVLPREICRYGETCTSERVFAGRTEHALVLSTDGAATWQVLARATNGSITQFKIVDHQWRALVNGRVLGAIAGELFEGNQPDVDRFDFFRDSPTPAANPLACTRGATLGSVTIDAREKGCFGGPRHTVTIRWAGATAEIETEGKRRPLPMNTLSANLGELEEVLRRSEGVGSASTTSTHATVSWTCSGATAQAGFHSEGHAANDEEAKARRALALFRLAARLSSGH